MKQICFKEKSMLQVDFNVISGISVAKDMFLSSYKGCKN